MRRWYKSPFNDNEIWVVAVWLLLTAIGVMWWLIGCVMPGAVKMEPGTFVTQVGSATQPAAELRTSERTVVVDASGAQGGGMHVDLGKYWPYIAGGLVLSHAFFWWLKPPTRKKNRP